MSDKAYVLMATNGEAWTPVAVLTGSEREAKEKAEMLNFRLFGNKAGSTPSHGDWAGFSIMAVDNNPKLEDTTGKQYHVVDPDDPDWHPPMDADTVCDGDPDDLYQKAIMLEHGWMQNYEYELREPEVAIRQAGIGGIVEKAHIEDGVLVFDEVRLTYISIDREASNE